MPSFHRTSGAAYGLLWLTFAVSAVPCQQSAPTPAVMAPPASLVMPQSGDLVLGAGDEISLHIGDMDEISDKPIRIDPDGNLDLPMLGRVKAAGLTVQQFRAELTGKVSKYVTTPEVTVNLVQSQSRSVSVIGEVNSPGVHQLSGERKLIEVISEAGGVKADAGPHVIITRQARWGSLPFADARKDVSGRYSTVTLSLDDLLASKRPGDNIQIDPDDVISIPKGDIVYVVGDVKKAGGFPLNSHSSISLLQALSLAEGFSPDAATQRAKILRPVEGDKDTMPKEIPVDVKSIFAGKSPDVPLYANDILFIPNSAAKSGTRRAVEAAIQIATGAVIYAR